MNKAEKWLKAMRENPPLEFRQGQEQIAVVYVRDHRPRLQITGTSFTSTEAIQLAKWILDTFGEAP